jgi:dUTPase
MHPKVQELRELSKWSQSFNAVKFSVDVGAGVFDPHYRGEVKVVLINNGFDNFHAKK